MSTLDATPSQHASIPSDEEVTRRLNAIFAGSGHRGPVEVVARTPHRLESFFPIEVVTCRLSDGTHRDLLLKFQSSRSHGAHGHRRGLAHEAEVYRRIIAPQEGARPRFYGTSTDESGDTCLVLEYLDRGTQVRGIRVRRTQHAAMVIAARWIARLHGGFESAAAQDSFGFLDRYDERYFTGWVRRTLELTSGLRATRPWLPRLCERAEGLLAPLWAGPPTAIHGEFYTNNILLCDGTIHAVDWEAAALGPGVIDLAALTEGTWPPRVVRRCERAYVRARWPHEAPPQFERDLEAARLYLHFRWLGDRREKTTAEKSSWRLEALRSTAAGLGLAGEGARRGAARSGVRLRT